MPVGMERAFRSPLHPSGSPFADSVSKGDSEGFQLPFQVLWHLPDAFF